MFRNTTELPQFVTQLWGTALALLLLAGCAGGPEGADKSNRGSLFESDPPGASVFVEGSFAGTTPARVPLPSKARVSVRIERPGYTTHEEILTRSAPPSAPDVEGWEDVYYFHLPPA